MPARHKATTATIVLYVRHGNTPTTGKVLPGRAPGLHLADSGVRQAEEVAARIASLGRVAAVYTSPLERARQTAARIAKACKLRPMVERGLIECDYGDWTGASLALLARKPEWRSVQRHPSGFTFPGGESLRAMATRIATTAEKMRERHPGEVVVAVSHADPIRCAITDALGLHLDLFQRLWIDTCSISAVGYGPTGTTVLAVNHTQELGRLAPR